MGVEGLTGKKKTLKPLNNLMKIQFEDENRYVTTVCP